MSIDGSRIVGYCRRYVYGDPRQEIAAALWTQGTGMVSLQDLLVSDYGMGEALNGWLLERPTDITDDGRFIVGQGTNPDGLKES